MDNCGKTYNSICRVCLKHNKIESMVSLREKCGRRSLVSFGKVLVKLARISIDYDDFLPIKICQNCKKMIQNINSFKLMCKNNDRKLRKFVNIVGNDSEKCKEMICEYTMFSQYFPSGTIKCNINPSADFQNTVKLKNKQELSSVCLKTESCAASSNCDSDHDYSFNIPFEENSTEPKNNGENADLFLDSIEKVLSNTKHQTPKHKSPSAIFQNTVKLKNKEESSACLKSESCTLSSNHESDHGYRFNIPFEDSSTEPKIDGEGVDLFMDSIEKVLRNINHQTPKQAVDSNTNIDTFISIEKTVSSQAKHIFKQKESSQTLNIDKFLDSLEEAVTTKTKRIKIKTKRKPPQYTIKNFHCDICNRTLASQASYNYHMQRHTKYRYICDQCGRGFPCKVPLQRHMVINHDKGPFLRCNHCDFKCARRFDLVEHIRVHTGERPFTCEKCGLTFRRRAIWKSHLIQHQEKNIPCPVCQKMFHRQCDVNWHINSAHKRTSFYLCSVCNTLYATGKTVRKHMLSKHGIPRDKQGKITRVTKDSNNVIFTDNNVPMIGYPNI